MTELFILLSVTLLGFLFKNKGRRNKSNESELRQQTEELTTVILPTIRSDD